VLADGEAADDGVTEAQDIMAQLGISRSQLIEGAYADLIAGAAEP
jgi:adenylate cyclase class IV